MKKTSKLIAVSAAVLLMGALSVTAFAASDDTSASLTEAQSERLELRRETLQERVEADVLTQEQADSMLQLMEQNMASCDLDGICDGTGLGSRGRGAGTGCGLGTGMGGAFRGGNGAGFRN